MTAPFWTGWAGFGATQGVASDLPPMAAPADEPDEPEKVHPIGYACLKPSTFKANTGEVGTTCVGRLVHQSHVDDVDSDGYGWRSYKCTSCQRVTYNVDEEREAND